jgi:LacI family transcriptional regulator
MAGVSISPPRPVKRLIRISAERFVGARLRRGRGGGASLHPHPHKDFYRPFLVGIERRAEDLECDLLLLTSGRRRIFRPESRLRLADGCILLGRDLDRVGLARLVREGPPFVSIGRRDDAGGRVPYVGADYATATAEVVRRARRLGHTRLAYLGAGEGAEAWTDRWRGFRDASTGTYTIRLPSPPTAATVRTLLDHDVTVVVCEEAADGPALRRLAPELSIITLGEPTRAAEPTGAAFTGIEIPREEMGAQAVDVLAALIEGTPTDLQRLLPCTVIEGSTLRRP